ncbi:MAG: Flp family type IVb pilin [Acidobacteria bacterium]|nr:Flp family type IVb pilin [Acidobacteriota bacterium]
MGRLRSLWRDDDGQDVVEYALLIAFVVVASAALLGYNGQNTAVIWNVTESNLNAASSMAS